MRWKSSSRARKIQDHFQPDRGIPDLSNKVILVTGGNAGLGKETILQPSKHSPALIFLGARSETKANAAITEIREAAPDVAPISFIELDLDSSESIKRAVNLFHAKSSRLDILINNAGIMAYPADTTKEGYEVQFGTNHMGHALLTKLLLPTLQETAKTQRDVRIVSLASKAEAWAPPQLWDFAQLKTDMESTSTFTRYGISKVATSAILAHCHGDTPTYDFPVFAPLVRLVSPLISKTPVTEAKNQLWACVRDDAKSGEFYHPVGLAGKGSPQSQTRKFEDDLWDWTEKELKTYM
ncbi:hypothetical protein ACJZ2D_016792 [Fusarium nematophilum]